MKYEDWIKYEEARLAEKKKHLPFSVRARNGHDNGIGPLSNLEASYRERCLLEVLLQQQALIDALQAQLTSMQPASVAAAL